VSPLSLRAGPDLLPAGALLALGEVEVALGDPDAPRWAIALLTTSLTAPLALRRRAPLLVLVWTVATVLVLGEIDAQFSQAAVPLAIGLATYTTGRELDAPRAWLALAFLFAVFALATLITETDANEFAMGALIYGGAWAFGRGLRAREQRVAALTQHTERLEQDRQEREQAAVAAERARIARELHDIVSHSISLIAVQAQAVRRRLGPGHQREIGDLEGVEAVARQALAEMRRLLGVLRPDGEPPSLAPQPGLDQLPRLLEEVKQAGVSLHVQVQGERVPLPPGVDLAAYRIVQEALTNLRKHAGGASATVTLCFGQRDLEITVIDDGDGAAPTAAGGGGLGLIGMRERVALYGGSLEAVPRPGGGFVVHARLPFREQRP
jgi:signal transduction histidine kinase